MPTYEYECEQCGGRADHLCAYSARPARLRCACGAEAKPVISLNRNSFMRNRPYEFRLDRTVMNFGRKYGRNVQQQEKVYQDLVQDMRKMVDSRGMSKKPDIEWLGTMPGEMVDSIGLHERDPEAVVKNPVDFLKRTDLYQGD